MRWFSGVAPATKRENSHAGLDAFGESSLMGRIHRDHAEIQMHGERERDRMSGLLPIFRDVGTSQCQFTVLFFNFTPSTQQPHHSTATPHQHHTTSPTVARTYTTPQILTNHRPRRAGAVCTLPTLLPELDEVVRVRLRVAIRHEDPRVAHVVDG